MNKKIKVFLLTLPAILLTVASCIFINAFYSAVTKDNAVFSLMLNDGITKDTKTDFEDELLSDKWVHELPDTIIYSDENVDPVDYAAQWAVLNIDNWETTDIPVYLGDTAEVLAQGAGQWIGSYYCGHGKNCIISANPMTWFYELEDTAIGTKLYMNTQYGAYEYEVTDKFVFYDEEIDILYEDLGEDTVILYTAYPNTKSFYDTDSRIALICSLRKGTIFKNRYEN